MAERAPHNVLIVTHEPDTTRLLLETLAARGVRGTVVRDVAAASERLAAGRWDLVLADLDAPGGGFEMLAEAKAACPELPVVLMAEGGSVRTAVAAMREGCQHFLERPLRPDDLSALMDAFVPNHDVALAASAGKGGEGCCDIVGKSPKLLEAVATAKKVAATSAPVLITGESGTGKELLSQLIHRSSPRRRRPYVTVNCGALSESLLESELFGHERGAFTGAHARRLGRFERADGGTLLLDEISETGPRFQAELLRVLEQQDFERVGGSEAIRVDVRVVSTSNRDMARGVETGAFRRDLFYRLSAVHIRIPPLRERAEDISALVWHLVNTYSGEVGRRIEDLDPEMMALFRQHGWPGNVRQLGNVVRAALILGRGPTLSLADTPVLRAELRSAERSRFSTLSLAEVEREAILQALQTTEMHQARAARLLGITDRTLREKLRRYRREGRLPERLDPGARTEPEPTGEQQCLSSRA